MTLQLTLYDETLGGIIDQMRFLLATVATDEGAELLRRMDEPLPPCEVGPKQPLHAIEAGEFVQAPPCTPDEVRDALRAYIARFGDAPAVMRNVPFLLGADRISDIPPDHLWRAKRALESAVSLGNPSNRKTRRTKT